MKKPLKKTRPQSRGKGQIVQCPQAPPDTAHFYWFKMKGSGEITGYSKCRTCGKSRDK